MRTRFIAALGLCALLLAPPAAAGQARSAPRPDEAALLRRRVVQLEDRVAQLEQQVARLEERLRVRAAWGAAPREGGEPTYLRLAETEKWRNPANWRLLRRGLGQVEVRYLLGEPRRVVVSDHGSVWYYPDARGGSVEFSLLGGRVEGWREP